jgi:hypothetical protein
MHLRLAGENAHRDHSVASVLLEWDFSRVSWRCRPRTAAAGRPPAGPALSPSRVRNAHQVLSQILAAGVEGGRIARNPAAGVRLPRIVRRDMHFLAAWQVEDLAAAIDPRYELLVRFAAYTGFAPGSWWRCVSGT